MLKHFLRLAFILILLTPIAPDNHAIVQPMTLLPETKHNYFPLVIMPNLSFVPLVLLPDPPPVWLGPDGGNVVCMAIDPIQSNIVYAGSWGAGVFKSTDGGGSWSPTNNGLGNLYINSMAIDPTNPSILYLGTYRDEVYKSTDAGQNWSHSNSGIQNGAIVYTIAVDPQNSQRVYIGTRGPDSNSTPPWGGVVYRTTDGGASWIAALTNIGGRAAQDWAYSLAILPKAPNEILAASHEHGPFRSTDYGVTWIAVSSGVSDGSGRAVVFDPRFAGPGTAYMGVWHHSGIYKTSNDGSSWSVKANGVGGARIYNMAIDPASPSILYAATFGSGVIKTTNGGDSWASVGLSFTDLYTVMVNPQNHAVLYAGSSGYGLYKSSNSGGSWSPSQHGLTNTNATAVIAGPDDGNNLLMSTYGSGIMQSIDGGITWTTVNTNLSDKFVHNLVESPLNPNIYYALTDTGGLFRIDLSASSSWSRITDQVPEPTSSTPAYTSNHPFAEHAPAVEDLPDVYGPRALESLPSSVPLLEMVFAPSNPQVVYLGTSGAGLYKSIDGGAHWNASGLAGLTIWGLAVDPTNPNKVYTATNLNGLLKVSQDGGNSWTDSSLPNTNLAVYSLAVPAVEPGTVLVGTSSGVYQLTPGGIWTSIGLLGQSVTALAPHPTLAGVLIAGTSSGAYRTIDGGNEWISTPLELSGLTIQSISFSALEPGVEFYTTKTSGALKATFSW